MPELNFDPTTELPILDPVLARRRRGDVVEATLYLLDLRGGPTDPIGVRAIGVDVGDAPDSTVRRANAPTMDAAATLDPRTGDILGDCSEAAAFTIPKDVIATAQAVRRFNRARTGVNRRSAQERRGWVPGKLLGRQQVLPLDPHHLVWLDGVAWSVDELCCVNPTCDCEELYFDFAWLWSSGEDDPVASGVIDLNRWEIVETWGHGPADELLTAWMAQPGAKDRAWDLYTRIRAAGAELVDPFVSRRGVVEPSRRCPCGSRKKYKRCCGRSRPSPVPGDLSSLRDRARKALIDAAPELLGEPLRLADADIIDNPVVTMSDEARWAWLLYWRHHDGFTLADRFLADPDRGDLWLRRWLEAASGTPPDIFQVRASDGRTALLMALGNLEEEHRQVLLSRPDELRVGEFVLAAPVRLMGRSVLEGAWRMSGDEDTGRALVGALDLLYCPVERLQHPDRVLQSMCEVAADAAGA